MSNNTQYGLLSNSGEFEQHELDDNHLSRDDHNPFFFDNSNRINNSNNNNNNNNRSYFDLEEEDKEDHSFIEVETLIPPTSNFYSRRYRLACCALLALLILGSFISILLYKTINRDDNDNDNSSNNNSNSNSNELPIIPNVKNPNLIVISIDGGRWDYLTKGITPNIQSMYGIKGSHATFITPQFPSKTFPNHFSLATGLYPEYHGIVGNQMFDSSTNQTYDISIPQQVSDPIWYWGEPIWVTAIKNNLTSACFLWPGCSAPIQGILPNQNIVPYQVIDAEKALDQVLEWQLINKPNLTMVYLHDVDTAGHKYGPDSQEVTDAIILVDGAIGKLMAGLERNNLSEITNILVISDHGMTTFNHQIIDITQWINVSTIRLGGSPIPILAIFPIENGPNVTEIYDALYGKHPSLTIYYKQDLPPQYNFNGTWNHRIAPIIGVADLGFVIYAGGRNNTDIGIHGYDPIYMDMKGIFVGTGPSIKGGKSNFNFTNVDLFNLYTGLLNITEVPITNGTNYLLDMVYKIPFLNDD